MSILEKLWYVNHKHAEKNILDHFHEKHKDTSERPVVGIICTQFQSYTHPEFSQKSCYFEYDKT